MWAWLTLLGAVATLLAGCGGDDNELTATDASDESVSFAQAVSDRLGDDGTVPSNWPRTSWRS